MTVVKTVRVAMVEVYVPSGYCSKRFWPPDQNKSSNEPIHEEFECAQPFSVYHMDQPHHIRIKYGHLGASPVCRANAAKSMQLLRHVLQPAINQDIVEALQKYISVFREAAENACENMMREPFKSSTSTSLDPDAMLLEVCRDALENAKSLFYSKDQSNKKIKESSKNKKVHESVYSPSMPLNIPTHVLPGKRRAASPDFPWNKRLKEDDRDVLQRRSLSPVPKKLHKTNVVTAPRRYGSPHRNTKEIVKKKIENWDPSRLTTDTEFVMGTKANRALGLGATRGRIYMKHPDLFKYAGDHDDKKWMVKHNCMAATGGKNTFIMMAADVLHLFQTEYKDSPGIMPEELQFFKLPEFVLQKMRTAMINEKKIRIGRLSKPSVSQASALESSPLSEHKGHKSATTNRTVRQAAQAAAAAISASSDMSEENGVVTTIVQSPRIPVANESESNPSETDSECDNMMPVRLYPE